MVYLIVLGSLALAHVFEGFLSGKAVVGFADRFAVGQAVATCLCIERHCELFEIGQSLSEFNLWAVEQQAENCLRSAGVLYHLVGEKQRWVVVFKRAGFLLVFCEFE